MENISIYKFLLNHSKRNPVSFHMPGHKGSGLYKRFGYDTFLENIMDCDITEIPGADNLFQTEGILEEAQKGFARLYDVKKSYLLINGTSGGIIASILATVSKGDKLIMARNCHKSVFNGLALAGADPVYAHPDIIEKYNITGAVSPKEIERLLDENQEAKAVILPSPNYYGICSDIESIAKIVHGRGKILIVDQAHGAHLHFFNKYGVGNFPKSAEASGADIIINSIHKTLGSFTQSAILNLNSERVDSYILEDRLQCIESTSPSYILMASLDIGRELLEKQGLILMKEWAENLRKTYEELRSVEGLEVMENTQGLDITKMNFRFVKPELSGVQVEELLIEKDIFIELTTGELVMCMSGIGNTREDFEKLVIALKEISNAKVYNKEEKSANSKQAEGFEGILTRKWELKGIPKEKRLVNLDEAEGMICASSIIPYPPGIPLVCPGEVLDRNALRYIKYLRARGEKVIGASINGDITVGQGD